MTYAREGRPLSGSSRAQQGLKARFPAFIVLACAVLFVARPATATVSYQIHLDHPEQHLFRVEMRIPQAAPGTIVSLPAWNALYQIRDFSYRVREVRAVAALPDSTPVELRKIDKQSWQIQRVSGTSLPATSDVAIVYSVEWNDAGPFGSQLNAHHAFINLAEILMYVPGRRNDDTQVEFVQIPDGWKVVTELTPAGIKNDESAFVAPSYDELVDAPVEAGKFDEFDFDEGGAHFRVVVDGKGWARGWLGDHIKRVVRYELQLMEGAPFREYTFLFHIGPYAEVGGGGMEHANSTAIASATEDGLVAIAAHEFFHAWNVKRIRPQSLEPIDYTKEQYTRALWFAEGVTSIYASYALERSGTWDKQQFYEDLAMQIELLAARPARKWQSVEESSLDAWFEKYEDYNNPERSISYYDKGQILGVMLDLAIRDATDNHKSLDDVLRRMNDEYAKRGKFYNDTAGVQSAVEEVAGRSFEDFFQHYVSGTDEIPYDRFLGAAGLELKLQRVKSADIGFYPNQPLGSDVVASAVEPGSAAEGAGLQAGDTVIQMNGREVPGRRGAWTPDVTPGETVKLRVKRNGQEMDIVYQVGTREEQTATIVESPHATDRQRRILKGLLRGTTD